MTERTASQHIQGQLKTIEQAISLLEEAKNSITTMQMANPSMNWENVSRYQIESDTAQNLISSLSE